MSETWSKLKPVRQRRLGDDVFDALERLIRSGELRVGQKLASEEELCRRFRVSRPVVRAALKRLREMKLIVSRRGAGSFVAYEIEDEVHQQAAFSQLKTMLYALEYRCSIEPDAARFAALRRNEAELARLRDALEAFRAAEEDTPPVPHADFLFHRAIALASRNDHYVHALELISYDIDLGITLADHLNRIGQTGRRQAIFGEHKAIVDAIEAQDADAAAAVMLRHLEYARARVIARGEAVSGKASV